MKKTKMNAVRFGGARTLTRAEMRKVIGGGEDLPNTWLCECGPNTAMSVYGTSHQEVAYNFLSVAAPNCTTDLTCELYGS